VSLFFFIVLFVLTVFGSIIGFRLLMPLKLPGWALLIAWSATQIIIYLPLITLMARRNSFRIPGAVTHLAWIMIGVLSFILFILLMRDFGLITLRSLSWISEQSNFSHPIFDESRRIFLSRTASLAIFSLGGLLTTIGMQRAYELTRIEEVNIAIKDLHPDLVGLRIIQFSDLHVSHSIKRGHVEAVVERINSLEGDLIVFTGDLADGTVKQLWEDVSPLKELRARLGKFAVTGNHEYYADPAGWLQAIPQLGLDLLTNENRMLQIGDSKLRIGGVPDISASHVMASHIHRPDIALPLDSSANLNILLAHQPRSIFAAEDSACDIMLAGHTHGGQYHPFTWMADKANPYLEGLHKHKKMWIYVSRGTGFWGPPIRLGALPEITVLTLQSA
jgi:uncharacterized protein